MACLTLAASRGNAQAACKAAVAPAAVEDFNAHARRYLDRFPQGGTTFASLVRALSTADRVTLTTIAKTMRTMTPGQKRSVGEGLADAVVACMPRDGEVARQIADVVRQASDPDVTEGYLKASSDDPDPGAKTAAPEDDARSSIPITPGQGVAIQSLDKDRVPVLPGGLLSQPRVQ